MKRLYSKIYLRTLTRQCIKEQRYFVDKGPYSESYGFAVAMYGFEMDHKEG